MIACSLHDLRKSDTKTLHHFELTDYCPMYAKTGLMVTADQQLVKVEIDKMVHTGIIRLASLSWSFLVVSTPIKKLIEDSV